MISHREAFEAEYNVYLCALRQLSASPKEQCELGSNYNVAWELKDEISRGPDLLENPTSTIAKDAINAVRALASSIESVPSSVLVAAEGFDSNIIAMNHPCWVPLRKAANELLTILASDA